MLIKKADIYRDFFVSHMRATEMDEADICESLSRLESPLPLQMHSVKSRSFTHSKRAVYNKNK